MKNKRTLLKRQIIYDLKHGIVLQYKKFLLFVLLITVLFLFFGRKVSTHILISKDDIIGFWDYMVYLFKGKEKIGHLSQLDIFDLPVEWILVHCYLLFAIGTYPKEDYLERGYQYLIRVGSKWYWWLSKGIYILVSVLIYYSSILVVAFAFTIIKGGSFHGLHKEIGYYAMGIDILYFEKSETIIGTVITPLFIFMALCVAEMFLSFLVSNMVSIIILLGYLSVSAYWCNQWLLGNYTMLLRKDELSLIVGIIISCGSMITCFCLGYIHFKQLDIIGKQKGDMD